MSIEANEGENKLAGREGDQDTGVAISSAGQENTARPAIRRLRPQSHPPTRIEDDAGPADNPHPQEL